MAPPFLKNISASASIWFIGIVVIVLTSVSMNILGPTLPLHTFLGWERVVFWLSANLIIFSLYGCIANTCSRSRNGDATYAPMWWFFSAGILFSSLLLYTSMQTSFVQPGTWVELKHNWEVVRYRFPEYEKMNKTVAIAEAGRYYKNTISVVGALLWCLFILISTVTYCAGRVLSCREVSKYILHISSVVGMIISAVLAGYAISLAGKPDQFGLSAHLPLKTGIVATFLFISSLSGLLSAINTKTPKYFICNFVMLAITLLVLIGTLISSYLYAEQVVDEFDSVPDLDLQNATRSAGITNMEWNKDDFKMVVRTHFASIGIFATFITLIVVGIFNASLYTCCVIRIGWFNTKFKFCHCRGCRCTKCVRMCMACNLPCADCCSNMCDIYDPENRRLTGRM
jgi:hypothetical protein